MTWECEKGDHDLCEGIIEGTQKACTCPCHDEEDRELFGDDERR